MPIKKRPGHHEFPWASFEEALSHHERVPLRGHGSCYVCGDANPHGIGVRMIYHEGHTLAKVTLGIAQQGAPGFAHGGSLAAILDELMGTAAWTKGHMVMSARIEVDYRRPVPLEQMLYAVAWVDRSEGRKVWTAGCIRDAAGQTLTESQGLFIEARQNFDLKAMRP